VPTYPTRLRMHTWIHIWGRSDCVCTFAVCTYTFVHTLPWYTKRLRNSLELHVRLRGCTTRHAVPPFLLSNVAAGGSARLRRRCAAYAQM
jgi:hypothetical protein